MSKQASVIVYSWGPNPRAEQMAVAPEVLVDGNVLDLGEQANKEALVNLLTSGNNALVSPVERSVYNHRDLASFLNLSYDDLKTINLNLPDIQRGLKYQSATPLFRVLDPANALVAEQLNLHKGRIEAGEKYVMHAREKYVELRNATSLPQDVDKNTLLQGTTSLVKKVQASMSVSEQKTAHLQSLDTHGKKAWHAFNELRRAAPNLSIFAQNNRVIHMLNDAALTDKTFSFDEKLASVISDDLTEKRDAALSKVQGLIQDTPEEPTWNRFLNVAFAKAPELEALSKMPESQIAKRVYEDHSVLKKILSPTNPKTQVRALFNQSWFVSMGSQGYQPDYNAVSDTKSQEFKHLVNLRLPENAHPFEKKQLDFLQSAIALNRLETQRKYIVDEQLSKMKADSSNQAQLTGTSKVPLVYSFANTQTGRDTTSSETLLNSHNMAKLSKTCLKAPEGYKVLSMDFKSLEPRVLASFHNNKSLIEAVNDRKDIYLHIESYMQVMLEQGKTPLPEDVNARYEQIANIYNNPDIDPAAYQAIDTKRQRTKALVNAVNYGMGIATMSRTLGVSKDMASRMMSELHQMIPEIQSASDKLGTFIKTPKTAQISYGGESGDLITVTTNDLSHYRKYLGDGRLVIDHELTPDESRASAFVGHPEHFRDKSRERSVLRVDWSDGNKLVYDDIRWTPNRDMTRNIHKITGMKLEPTEELCKIKNKRFFDEKELSDIAVQSPHLVNLVKNNGQSREVVGTVASMLGDMSENQEWLKNFSINNPKLVDLSYETHKGERKELPQHTFMQNINQASATMIMNEYTASTYQMIKDNNLDVKMVGRIHDELAFVVKDDGSAERFRELCEQHQAGFQSNRAKGTLLELDVGVPQGALEAPKQEYVERLEKAENEFIKQKENLANKLSKEMDLDMFSNLDMDFAQPLHTQPIRELQINKQQEPEATTLSMDNY